MQEVVDTFLMLYLEMEFHEQERVYSDGEKFFKVEANAWIWENQQKALEKRTLLILNIINTLVTMQATFVNYMSQLCPDNR